MAINLAALKDVKKGLDEKTGSKGFLNTKDLTPDGVLFRLAPPPPILNGIFHFNVHEWWFPVNGKQRRIIDVSAFGKDSVIQAEIDAAYAENDDDINQLLEAINPNSKRKILTMQESAWMSGWQLEYQYSKSDADEITGVTVVDGCGKIFQCGKPTLLSDIIGVITGGPAARRHKGCEDGIADRVKGSNILLSKEGAGLNTKYKAVLDDEYEMDAKWYRNPPNVYETAKAQTALASWQRAAIRNYIYGEPIPTDVQAKEDTRAEKAKALFEAAKAAAPVEAPAAKAKKPAPVDDEEETPAPKPKAKKPAPTEDDEEIAEPTPPAKAPKKSAAPIELDDDDDTPTPPKKNAVKKPAAPVDLDDDDDAPTPVVKKKSPPPPPAPTKKAPQRSILDDIDED